MKTIVKMLSIISIKE